MDLQTGFWALIEIMGHRRRAGFVREVEVFGAKQLQIDVPVSEGDAVTEFYGGAAIFSLRPCTEEIARDVARDLGDVRPIRPCDYREAETGGLVQIDLRRPSGDAYDDDRPF